jgi:hypothetical protein
MPLERPVAMSHLLLVYAVIVIVLLMAKTIADLYLGEAYVCPSCGARSDDQHTEDCQLHS